MTFGKGIVVALVLLVALTVAGSAFARGGSLDSSFGTGGVVLTQVGSGPDSYLTKLVSQPDGRIIASGWAHLGTRQMLALVRYRKDGGIDSSFGARGSVLGTGGAFVDLVVLSTGKLAGVVPLATTDPGDESGFAIVRYLRDGRVDRSFGKRGRVAFDGSRFQGFTVAMVRKHDDRLIVLMAPTRYTADADVRGAGIVLVQLRADGRLDRTFGDHGVARLNRSLISPAAIALRRDGKIVVAGWSGRKPPHRGVLLARYLPSGRLDRTFGQGGLRTASLGLALGSVNSLIAAPGGDLIVGGSGSRVFEANGGGFLVADFRSNGTPRTSFGDGGVALVDFISGIDGASAIVRQPDGRIVAAGTLQFVDASAPTRTVPTRAAFLRLLPNGQPDPAFGTDGRFIPPPVTSGDNGVNDLVRQPSGRLVAGGVAGIRETTAFPPTINIFADPRFMLLGVNDR